MCECCADASPLDVNSGCVKNEPLAKRVAHLVDANMQRIIQKGVATECPVVQNFLFLSSVEPHPV